MKGQNARKKSKILSKMKKILKMDKKFQKGYLQTAFYVVHYGKLNWGKGGLCKKIVVFSANEIRHLGKFGEIRTPQGAAKAERGSKSGKNRYH